MSTMSGNGAKRRELTQGEKVHLIQHSDGKSDPRVDPSQ